MEAITIHPGEKSIHYKSYKEPVCKSPFDVKLKVLEVGICGTDREEVHGGRATAPSGHQKLVIGHEMLGQVVAVGEQVQDIKVGDHGVFSVRRGCGKCKACQNNRSDMCYTGDYKERGIKGQDGYETEFVVDHRQFLVKVPEEMVSFGVLTEPMSIAEKAIDEAVRIQMARLPEVSDDWLKGKKALVAGLGTVGLLAVVALRLRGAEVVGLDVVNESSKRVSVLKQLGGEYIHGKEVKATAIDERYGEMDFIFEATGIASLGFNLIDALGVNGIYVMTGIPGGDRPVSFAGGEMMRQMVLKNQLILGSVNAGIRHFDLAVKDLVNAGKKYGKVMGQLITSRFHHEDFMNAIRSRTEDDIKTVITWS